VPFTIDPARKTRLLNGWDELDLTARHKDRIAAFARKIGPRGRGRCRARSG
jgi:3-isopropylmalate/(R)-2-methylmalate dehydratase small subunit